VKTNGTGAAPRAWHSATPLLFGEQAQVLVLAPGVALGDGDSAEQHGRIGLATQGLGVGE